tara:strand:+ start:122 stop:274 length:153 start_codon:yes stop_codon:yes gene_type:complete
MSEEERLRRKKLRMRPCMIKRALDLGLIDNDKYIFLITHGDRLTRKSQTD